MITIQAMRAKTEYMMEQLRIKAINETYQKWQEAIKEYYKNGYDNGESVKLYKELETLGADTEQLIDKELEIREQYI